MPQALHTCAFTCSCTFKHTFSHHWTWICNTDKHILSYLIDKFQHCFLSSYTLFYELKMFSFFQFIWQIQQLFSKLNKNRKGKNNPTLWDSNSAVQCFPEENSFSLEYGHNFVKPEFHYPNINLNKVKSSENRKGNLNYVEWYVHFFSETYGLVNCTSFSQIASSNI